MGGTMVDVPVITLDLHPFLQGLALGRGWCSYMHLRICSRLSAAVAPGRLSSSTCCGAGGHQ